MTTILKRLALLFLAIGAGMAGLYATGLVDLEAAVSQMAHKAEPIAGAAAKPALSESTAPAVSVMAAREHDFTETVLVTGSLAPREEVLVAPEIDGLRIVELAAEEGDAVAAGAILARLERETLAAELAQNSAGLARAEAAIAQSRSLVTEAEARLAEAKSQLDRAEPLTRKGYVSESTLDTRAASERTARAQLESARNGIALAEAERSQLEAQRRTLVWRLSRTDIKAPVAGLVSRRTARLGDVVAASREPLFRLIEDGRIELEAKVPEPKLARLAAQQPARLFVEGSPPRDAVVRLVSPEVDTATRLGRVRLLVGDPTGLKIGAFGRAEVRTRTSRGLAVASSALLYSDSRPRVLRVADGRVQSVEVTTGLVTAGLTEIVSGLAPGDLVVTKAGTFLRDGDAVRPIEPAAAVSKADVTSLGVAR
ncbi:MAG: efflux RND transporter periplasmic adaptor subunit [Hyphomicrobiaceae bacterium]|nr:efflux RND transporter periplasmic adaptor subunit [Hyphomicrobiaceae bacterium]